MNSNYTKKAPLTKGLKMSSIFKRCSTLWEKQPMSQRPVDPREEMHRIICANGHGYERKLVAPQFASGIKKCLVCYDCAPIVVPETVFQTLSGIRLPTEAK